VYVVDKENRARLRVVQLAARQQGDTIRVVSGIEESDRVATSNLADLYDGLEVTLETADTSQDADQRGSATGRK
jgi:hypothetical protein